MFVFLYCDLQEVPGVPKDMPAPVVVQPAEGNIGVGWRGLV